MGKEKEQGGMRMGNRRHSGRGRAGKGNGEEKGMGKGKRREGGTRNFTVYRNGGG